MCSLNSQISLASKNRAPICDESAPKSLSLVTGITMFFFCGEMFWTFSVLDNLTCAQETLWPCVAWWTQTFFIRSSNWIILNTAFAQSVELSEGRKIYAEFCQYWLPGSPEFTFAFTSQRVVIEAPERAGEICKLRLHTVTCRASHYVGKATPNKQRAAKPYKMAMNWARLYRKSKNKPKFT